MTAHGTTLKISEESRPIGDGTNWAMVWAISVAAGLLMAALEAASVYPLRWAENRPLPFLTMFRDTAAHEILDVLCIPLIYKLALLFPFAPKRIFRSGLVHLIASMLFAITNGLYHFLLFPLHISPDSYRPVTPRLIFGFSSYAWFTDTCSTYIPVLAIAYMYSYYHKYREGEMQTLRLDAQLAQAQLQFLRSQLNPHFLFNTLHSITSLMHFDIEAADKMMAQLSDLLRMALQQTETDETELKQELDFVDRYLAIEKTRLGDRLRLTRHIADDTLHALVPPMILQPLVENAVIHGISQLVNGGELYIRSAAVSGTLRLTVRNKGSLRTPSFRPPGHSGVGISNIRERLIQMYGDDHSFLIEEDGKGTVEVSIILPLKLSAAPPELSFDHSLQASVGDGLADTPISTIRP